MWKHGLVAQPTPVLESGAELAGFRIESFIGQGETGTVYRATQLRRDREVALKVLAAHRGRDPEFRERFIRESKLAASLYQPNVLPVYDVGEVDGVLYVAMRYAEGGDLGRLLQENGRIGPVLALGVGRQIALALGAAHSERLVHGNVKPANILLGGDEDAYLADFGLERSASAYSAPEQLDGVSEVDRRADIYSLGCVLYHCLAGEPPRSSDAGPRLMELRPDLPRWIAAMVGKAMEKDPSSRYSTAPEFAAALGAALTDLGGTEPERTETALGQAETQILFPLVGAEQRRSLPSPARRVVIAALVLAVVAAAIGAFVAFGSTGSTPLRVPRVVGIQADQAEVRLRRARFAPVIRYGSSDRFADGLVYRTIPSPGSALGSGRPVTIWISTGPPTSVVPNVVGESLSRAKRVLAAAHLELKTKRILSGQYTIDRVTRQSPRRGGRLPAGDTMTLWVSTGQPRALVPDVRGESAQQATRDLRSAGFKVRNAGPATATSDPSLAGKVAGQSPVGVKARKKSVVTIYLYYYVAPSPPPPPPSPPVTYPSTIGVT